MESELWDMGTETGAPTSAKGGRGCLRVSRQSLGSLCSVPEVSRGGMASELDEWNL